MAQQPSVGAEVSEQKVVRRKAFLEFRDDDLANLVSINDVARRYADSMIDDFYKHLLSFKQTSAFLHDAQGLERITTAQQQYFLRLTQGNYDLGCAENRLHEPIEQLLSAVRANRAKVVVMDITGVQAVDSKVGTHLVQAAEAVA